jgi:hypothetical protein
LTDWQLKDYESRLGKPFQHEEYASQLADLRDRLKLGLSERAPEGGTPTADLAEQIKTLRASLTVEAASERVTRKAVRAERPVTARIRKRRESIKEAKVEPVIAEPELKSGKPDERPSPPPAQVIKPAMYQEKMPDHRQHLTKRRDNTSQLRLF